MPGQNQTITIKKADGTTERITLAEFKLRQKSAVAAPTIKKVQAVPAVSSVPTAPVAVTTPTIPPAPKPVPAEIITKTPAMGKAVQEVPVAPVSATPALVGGPAPKPPVRTEPIRPSISVPPPSTTAEDVKSLLDEPLPTVPGDTTVSHDRFDQVDRILKKLSFSVAPDQANRLRSLIQLRLKDIRSEADTKATAMRPVKEGGLGLSETSAAELVAATASDHQPVVPKALRTLPALAKEMLPAEFHEAGLPATTAPFNSFKHTSAVPNSPAPRPLPRRPVISKPPTSAPVEEILKPDSVKPPIASVPKSEISPQAPAQLPSIPPQKPVENFKLNSSGVQVKPVAHDIMPPSGPVGPLEELAALTIADFRRLASDSNQAATILWQKFSNLKDESIVFYLQGVDAWRRSPLYQEYSRALVSSLAENKALNILLVDKNHVQVSEIVALAGIEAKLKQ